METVILQKEEKRTDFLIENKKNRRYSNLKTPCYSQTALYYPRHDPIRVRAVEDSRNLLYSPQEKNLDLEEKKLS